MLYMARIRVYPTRCILESSSKIVAATTPAVSIAVLVRERVLRLEAILS